MRRADYSKLARAYDSSRLPMYTQGNVWLDALLRRGEFSKDDLVLEVGCGTGRWTLALADKCRVVGMEPCWEMLIEATTKPGADGATWVRGSAPEIPFRDQVFDRIVLILVLQHIEDLQRTFEETFRILKPGGRVVIRTCGHDYIRRYPLGEYFPGYREVELNSFPEVGGLMDLMRRIGFDPVDSETVVQRIVGDAGGYLERVRNRYISTLYRIGEENFRIGYERLSRELAGKETFTYTMEHEFVLGIKPV